MTLREKIIKDYNETPDEHKHEFSSFIDMSNPKMKTLWIIVNEFVKNNKINIEEYDEGGYLGIDESKLAGLLVDFYKFCRITFKE